MLSKINRFSNLPTFKKLLSLNTNTAKFSRCLFSNTTKANLYKPPRILNDIQSDELVVELTKNKKEPLPYSELKFGSTFTDHMLEVDQDNEYGQHQPRILPYHNFEIDPACSALHYALQCFEGMKAYRDTNNSDAIRLFRPSLNIERLLVSCETLFFPTFNKNEFLSCLKELIRIERDQIPNKEGYSLYIRPTVISTHPFIGVGPASKVKLYVILSPVGPYYPEGFSAIKLYADEHHVRAQPGGAGAAKIGSNYAPTIRPQMEALKMGYTQILQLHENNVTEVGTMNQFFFQRRKKDNKKELITAPLDGTILPGITRDSILSLCREQDEFEVTERKYSIFEVIEAIQEGRILEAFGSGTAAVVSPVKGFHFRGKDYSIPLDIENVEQQAGPLTKRLQDSLVGIQVGKFQYKDQSELVSN